MLDDTPQTRVVLADKAGGSGHRHILDESHDERFEQKREAGSRPCPRHVDEAHATVGTVDAGDARVQEGLVLKEIEVAPGLLHRVVHRAVGLAALGTGKAATGLEVDLDIEPLLVDVEFGVHHHPRRHQAESELEQIDVAHGALSSRLVRRHRAAVLVAVKNKPLRARDPRAFLTATRNVGVYSVRPGRKDGSAGPNKRIGRRAKRPFPPSWSPTHLSEEAKNAMTTRITLEMGVSSEQAGLTLSLNARPRNLRAKRFSGWPSGMAARSEMCSAGARDRLS